MRKKKPTEKAIYESQATLEKAKTEASDLGRVGIDAL